MTEPSAISEELANEDFCYLTTTGRVSGKAHTIEIWFAAVGNTLYLLAGGGAKADWVRNLRTNANVGVRIRDLELEATARVVDQPDERSAAAAVVYEKYAPRYSGDLASWRESALPIAVDLIPAGPT